MKNRRLWRGLTALTAFLLIVSMLGSSIAFRYAGTINATFGIATSKVVTNGDSSVDTEYYKSEYGELSDANLEKLIADAYAQCVNEQEEGSVLLKNENNALPLTSNERRVTLFGHATVQPVYKPTSGGASASGDYLVTYYDALVNAGFEVNETLYNAYLNSSTSRAVGTVSPAYGVIEADLGEEPISFYTDSIRSSWENDYNDAAIVMIAREGGEDADLTMNYQADGNSQLSFQQEERDLLQMIRDSGKFDKIIVILNSPWAMELDWLDEYDVDACLWIGNTGLRGFEGIPNLLTGAANPSGKLTDTFAASSMSSPAATYATNNVQQYTNVDEVTAYCSDDDGYVSYYTIYAEGIYVGYKYYETRYEDLILGRYGADSTVGSSTGSAWNYADEMCFPFGYGLSYTTFQQTLDSVTKVGSAYTVEVTVKNTGNVAGKSVVELYAQKPYGDYEIKNKVESSAVQLVGFGKTGMLDPGKSEKVTITVDEYLLASYDYTGAKGYILSQGTYYFAIGDNAHDALNNILAAKGAEGMYDEKGNPVNGNIDNTYSFEQGVLDTATYRNSPWTGEEVTNLFEKADINYWIDDTFTYLSRSNWAGTFPASAYRLTASQEMIEAIDGHLYETPADAPSVDSFTQGADNGLTFADMKDVPYEDDETWNKFLDQLTVEELSANMSTDMSGSYAIDSVMFPALWENDGIDGVKSNYLYGDGRGATCYPGKAVLASTWNYDLVQRRGELMGEEALYCKAVTIWCGGGDIDRTPFSGRNFEYYSEDGYLGYLMSAVEMKALQEKGVVAAIKHFAGNDQEQNRESLATFFNEQSFRENNLKVFEGAFCLGGSLGTMQGFSRIGPTFMSQSSVLIKGVLRNEWGYQGKVITDAVAGASYKTHYAEMLTNGVDYYCWDLIAFGGDPVVSGDEIISRINSGDGYLLQCLREANKNIFYADSRSMAVNGIDPNSEIVYITPAWQTACYAAQVIFGILTVAFAALYIYSELQTNKEKKEAK